ncbi:MAG: FAD-binding oxidoreductase, partial [Firmicutes bacterium]|nr:FAD-binding oxidoreductase [Bacillota bacterium]
LALKRPEIAAPDTESQRALAAMAAAPEQFFSPDPTETTAALGGMASCNSSGARTYLYGPTRPHIAGLRLVLADGDLLTLSRGQVFAAGRKLTLTTESGRRLDIQLPGYTMPACKNASGYYVKDDMDAIDLIIGSDGTLGVISQLTLTLLHKPASICGLTCFMPSEEQTLSLVEAVREQVGQVAAIEYFDRGVMDLLAWRQTWDRSVNDIPPLPGGLRHAVYFELHCGDKEEVMARLSQISRLMEDCGGDSRLTWAGWNQRDLERLHAFRHTVPESANLVIDDRKRSYPALSKCSADMSVPDARLRDVMALYRRGLAAERLQAAVWGHIGNNHVHVGILPRDMEEYDRAQALIRSWARQVSLWGGAVSAEHGIGKSKRALLAIMYGEEQVAQMAAVKQVFDPKGLLSPGNLFPPQSSSGPTDKQ